VPAILLILPQLCRRFVPITLVVFVLSRIRLNKAYLKLGARNPDQAELELLMRRKEFLDEVHQVMAGLRIRTFFDRILI
jgi:hypothetical protein